MTDIDRRTAVLFALFAPFVAGAAEVKATMVQMLAGFTKKAEELAPATTG